MNGAACVTRRHYGRPGSGKATPDSYTLLFTPAAPLVITEAVRSDLAGTAQAIYGLVGVGGATAGSSSIAFATSALELFDERSELRGNGGREGVLVL